MTHSFISQGIANVKVASIDAYQGQEKDVIIMSCVRAKRDKGIGFLSHPQRMNVAITRAKMTCIIIGSFKDLEV